jgi:peptide/nickel transport system substrate-binding protein
LKYALIPVIIVLVCAIILTGCSSSPTTTAPAAPATKAAPATSTSAAPATSTPAALVPTTVAKPTASASLTPVSGGTLVYLDPTTVGGPLGLPWLNRQQYNGFQLALECLLDVDRNGTLLPRLAESWDLNADPNSPSITFHLRKGVKFHDGSDFNAKVLVWNLNKYKEGGYLVTSRYIKTMDILDD